MQWRKDVDAAGIGNKGKHTPEACLKIFLLPFQLVYPAEVTMKNRTDGKPTVWKWYTVHYLFNFSFNWPCSEIYCQLYLEFRSYLWVGYYLHYTLPVSFPAFAKTALRLAAPLLVTATFYTCKQFNLRSSQTLTTPQVAAALHYPGIGSA